MDFKAQDSRFLKQKSSGFWIPEAKISQILSGIQALVVQTLDSAIHRIDLYPVDKCLGNQLRYPLNRDLSNG